MTPPVLSVLNGVKRALVSLGVIIVVTACLRGVAEQRTLHPESCRRPVLCPFMSPCSETLLPFCIAENWRKAYLDMSEPSALLRTVCRHWKRTAVVANRPLLLLVQLVKFTLLSLPSFLISGFKTCTNNLTCRKCRHGTIVYSRFCSLWPADSRGVAVLF